MLLKPLLGMTLVMLLRILLLVVPLTGIMMVQLVLLRRLLGQEMRDFSFKRDWKCYGK